MDSSVTADVDAAIAALPEGNLKTHALQNMELFNKYYPLINEDIWKKSEKYDDQVSSFHAKTEDGKLMAKGVGQLPFKPEKVMKFYEKIENKPLYDEYFSEGKMIDSVQDKDHNCEFFYTYTRRGNLPVVKDRDFVANLTRFKIGDKTFVVSHSVDHPDYPENKDAVRGHLEFLICEFAPGPEGKGCIFTRVFKADPKGSVPDMIKGLIIKRSGQEMVDLRKAMLEWFSILKWINSYFSQISLSAQLFDFAL